MHILEIGSWIGFSTLTWAHAVAMLCDAGGSVSAVDTWAPYFAAEDVSSPMPVYGRMERLARNGLAFELFRHNAGCGPASVPIKPLRGRSSDVMATLPAASFDLIYIDGSHYYDAVKSDLAMAPRLLRPGGILCGDDLELQVGEISEAEARGATSTDCTRDKQGRWYHPGVTLAVHEALGPVSQHGRTWYMRKTPGGFSAIDAAAGRMAVPPHWPAAWQARASTLLSP